MAAISGDSGGSTASHVAVAALCGLVFGTAINKSGVFNATVLRDQFNFSNYVMLKVRQAGGRRCSAVPALRG